MKTDKRIIKIGNNHLINIIFEYKDGLDIRLLSHFFYHLKASATFLKQNLNNDEIDKIKIYLDEWFQEKEFLDLETLSKSSGLIKEFKGMYYSFVHNRRTFQLFINEDPKIEIVDVQKGSIKFNVRASVSFAIIILAAAMAYNIISSKKSHFDINLLDKVKINVEVKK
jgi:hypothetical protein